MRIFNGNGIGVEMENNLFIDPTKQIPRNSTGLVSHCHSDHAKKFAFAENYLMSNETKKIFSQQLQKKVFAQSLEFGKKKKIGNSSLSLHFSGHVLGGSQTRIESNKTIVITSDMKLQNSLLFNGAEILPADALAIETTFGKKEFVFPERTIVYEEMKKWAEEILFQKKLLILSGYSFGKAQELTKFCNEYLNIAPLVFHKIFDYNKIYEESGVKLGEYIKLNHNFKESNVIILPPTIANPHLFELLRIYSGKKIASAIATGWQQRIFPFQKNFALSDHADFSQLMDYVKQSNPKIVYTCHGFSNEFARSLKKEGFEAKSLEHTPQTTIAEFTEN